MFVFMVLFLVLRGGVVLLLVLFEVYAQSSMLYEGLWAYLGKTKDRLLVLFYIANFINFPIDQVTLGASAWDIVDWLLAGGVSDTIEWFQKIFVYSSVTQNSQILLTALD